MPTTRLPPAVTTDHAVVKSAPHMVRRKTNNVGAVLITSSDDNNPSQPKRSYMSIWSTAAKRSAPAALNVHDPKYRGLWTMRATRN